MKAVIVPSSELTDGTSGSEHDLLHASRVSFHKFGDVVDLSLVGHPDARRHISVLGHVLMMVEINHMMLE